MIQVGRESPIYLWNSRDESVPPFQLCAQKSFSFATHQWRCRNSNTSNTQIIQLGVCAEIQQLSLTPLVLACDWFCQSLWYISWDAQKIGTRRDWLICFLTRRINDTHILGYQLEATAQH